MVEQTAPEVLFRGPDGIYRQFSRHHDLWKVYYARREEEEEPPIDPLELV